MTEIVVSLDLDGVVDKAGLMDRCARALDLPDWFGRNWDALAESLADHDLWPREAVERGRVIVVRNWRPYAGARPADWETAREVFGDAMRATTGLTIALALGGNS
ncbi:barstar family protein [Streptomyces sp. NPDC004610]|uniref:barstar family protein n=1 Tax=unclassified Streptomyces TaxID=2593676 RepID=UPI0033A64115